MSRLRTLLLAIALLAPLSGCATAPTVAAPPAPEPGPCPPGVMDGDNGVRCIPPPPDVIPCAPPEPTVFKKCVETEAPEVEPGFAPEDAP